MNSLQGPAVLSSTAGENQLNPLLQTWEFASGQEAERSTRVCDLSPYSIDRDPFGYGKIRPRLKPQVPRQDPRYNPATPSSQQVVQASTYPQEHTQASEYQELEPSRQSPQYSLSEPPRQALPPCRQQTPRGSMALSNPQHLPGYSIPAQTLHAPVYGAPHLCRPEEQFSPRFEQNLSYQGLRPPRQAPGHQNSQLYAYEFPRGLWNGWESQIVERSSSLPPSIPQTPIHRTPSNLNICSIPPAPRPQPEQSRNPNKPARKRARQACENCRSERQKCIREEGMERCNGCVSKGPESIQRCTYADKGGPNLAREKRKRPRPSSSSTRCLDTSPKGGLCPQDSSKGLYNGFKSAAGELVSAELLLHGCKRFAQWCSQLKALEENSFFTALEGRLKKDSPIDNIQKFFLAAGLSIAAPSIPDIAALYGGQTEAGNHFLTMTRDSTQEHMRQEHVYEVDILRARAFLFLALAEWEKGLNLKARIDLITASKMTEGLRCEVDGTRTDEWTFAQNECACRILRKIENQESFQEGGSSNTSDLGEIRAMLCQAWGSQPQR